MGASISNQSDWAIDADIRSTTLPILAIAGIRRCEGFKRAESHVRS
jgi:hypothetical protein